MKIFKKATAFFLLLAVLVTCCQALPREASADALDGMTILDIDAVDPDVTLQDSTMNIENWARFGAENDHAAIPGCLTVTKDGIVMERRCMKYGTLRFQFSNVRAVNSVSDMPEGELSMAKCSTPLDIVFNKDGTKRYVTTEDSDFVQPDGKFYPGAYIVLVDVTVYSDGAVEYTTEDYCSHGGYPMGSYADPYLFRADVIKLADLSIASPGYGEEDDIVTFYNIRECYYSLYGCCEENPMLFRLTPGETLTYTLGFLVGDKQQGGKNDFASLMIHDLSKATNYRTYIDPHLTNPTD